MATGKELCSALTFRDGTWAVADPQGRFDASDGGDADGLHWVVGLEPIALTQLKERYYDPGLLAKHFGFNKEPLRDVAAFQDVKLYPGVAVVQPDPKKPQLDVTLTNRGGGIGAAQDQREDGGIADVAGATFKLPWGSSTSEENEGSAGSARLSLSG